MRALVIGIGNPLQRDEGLGEAVIQALERDGMMATATFVTCDRLTTELAVDLAAANVVVFVDASAALPPAVVRSEAVRPSAGGTARSHRCTPGDLLAEALDLFGRAPVAHRLTVGAGSLDAGQGLSPEIRALVPQLAAHVRDLLDGARQPRF